MKKTGKLLSLIVVFVICGVIAAVSYYSYINMGGPKMASATVPLGGDSVQNDDTDELNIYIWEDYISDKAISSFESKYKVSVNVICYDEEEAMLSGVMSEPGKYDVCIVSGLYVANMSRMKLLAKLDHKNIPNMSNINDKFINPPYDRYNQYSVSYMWGTTGLVINKEFIKDQDPGWEVLFDRRYAGRIGLINDSMECFAVSLIINGKSINSSNMEDIKQASKWLTDHKDMNYKILPETDLIEKLINGELWGALIYSGEVIDSTDGRDEFEYIIPKVGYSMWVDNMCIPAASEHKYMAELFINHILDANVSAEIASSLYQANTNLAAARYTDVKVMADKRLYPSAQLLQKGESFSCEEFSLEKQQIYNRTWQVLKAE